MPENDTKQSLPLIPQHPSQKADEIQDAIDGGKPRGDLDKLVSTRWQIDYNRSLDAAREGKVVPRTSSSALFVDSLRIQPKDPSGGDTSRYEKNIEGVGLAKSGAAHLGSFPLPKGFGGSVTANVAYGTRPTFDFSIKTHDQAVVDRDHKEHTQLVERLAQGLDDFVEPGEAQRVLDQLIQQQFPSKDVTGTIKQSKSPAKNQAVTALDYAPLTGDRLFDLAVEIPTQTDKDMQTNTVSKNDENTNGNEQTHGKSNETEGNVTSQQENTFINSLTTTVKAGMKNLAASVLSGGFSNGFASAHARGTDTDTNTRVGFKADIGGKGEIGLGDLPLIGKLASGEISFKINPDFSTDIKAMIKGTDTDTTTLTAKLESAQTNELAHWIETHTESMVTQSFKMQITSAIRTKATDASGGKKSEGQKTGRSTTTTVTKGTVVSLQNGPIKLVENKK